MSDLTPHLRVLRGLAEALDAKAEVLIARLGEVSEPTPAELTSGIASLVIRAISAAHREAADQLEAEEEVVHSRFINREQNFHYDPKGKP